MRLKGEGKPGPQVARLRPLRGAAHFFFCFFFFSNFMYLYLFMAVLGLCFRARAFSSCGKRGPLLIAVRGPLIIAASPAEEHRLQTRRLSNCGTRAQPLHGMWDLPRPGPEPVSPASAGRPSTTAPPGKPPGGSSLLREEGADLAQLLAWEPRAENKGPSVS